MKERERILIAGFMAAGKTTVAEALARRLGCPMLDLDGLIAEHEGRSIQAIIDEEGEARFRSLEERRLREALEHPRARVIALGGGTWANARNRALIARHSGFTVWLDAPFKLCWQRIKRAGDTRPLARSLEQALELYESRRAVYGLAPLRVPVGEDDSPDEVAAEIARALERRAM